MKVYWLYQENTQISLDLSMELISKIPKKLKSKTLIL